MVSIFFFVFLFPFKKKKKKKKKSLQTTAHVSRECRDGGGGSKKISKNFKKSKKTSKNGGVVTRVEDWKIDAKHLFRFFCVFFFKETLIFFFVK